MLSVKARRLYQRLLETGPVPRAELAPDTVGDEAISELADLGLLDATGLALRVLPPRAARHLVAVRANRRSRDLLSAAVETDRFLEAVVTSSDSDDPDDLVAVVQSPSEVQHLSTSIHAEARQEAISVVSAAGTGADVLHNDDRPISPTGSRRAPFLADSVHVRIIYPPAQIADAAGRARLLAATNEAGEEARIHPDPTSTFKIVDRRVALVPLDTTGTAGALLIRSPTICALLVDYFSKLWAESTPVRPGAPRADRPLMPTQQRVLEMLAEDHTDATIARRLQVSERTVRRHLGVVFDTLGVQTRHGAVYAATKRGLLGTTHVARREENR